MEKLKAYWAKAETWVDDHPRMTLILGSVAVIVMIVLGAVF